ncbi:alpha/beta fold hydrolase [Luteimonas salinisoli]|uniref:alpha/beta fold hydrolase n=1 Tax=Luteimonas salinisoli TaxID=2752307 RepID=UPI003CE58E5E
MEVLLLPGLDGTATLLEAFCSRLGDLGVAARAIAYPPDRALGYLELEAIVRAQLRTSNPFVLLGESFSGPLAILVAANAPVGLAGLVLSTTFARAPVPALSPLAPLVRFAPVRPPMPLLSWSLLGPWATPALRSQLAAALRSVSPAALRARAAAAMRIDVSQLLPSVQVPVLQLVAGEDRLLVRSASEELAASLSDCRTVVVAGPHLLLQTSTEACAQEVAAFVRGLDPDDSSCSAPPRRTPQG